MEEFEHEENSSFLRRCPRCNQLESIEKKECGNCGYIFESETSSTPTLSFGLDESKKGIFFKNIEYSQEETKKMRISGYIQNILTTIIGLVGLLVIFVPIMSKYNIYYYIDNLSKYYDISIEPYLYFDKEPNLINLFASTFKFIARDFSFDASYFIGWYQILLIAICLAIIFISGHLLVFSFQNAFLKKKKKAYKRSVVELFIISNIMLFALGCYGVLMIILASLSAISLILFYVIEVISKEKKFNVRHVVIKTICFGLLFSLFIISSLGLVNLDVTNGSNLYNYEDAIATSMPSAPNIYHCRGLFLGFVQFLHSQTDDHSFTILARTISLMSLTYQFLFILFLAIGVGLILGSFTKQSVRFPLSQIIISALVFYVFAILVLIYNNVINSIYLSKYIELIGNGIYEQLSPEAKESVIQANKVFTVRPSFIFSMIIYLPISIFAINAKKRAYRA